MLVGLAELTDFPGRQEEQDDFTDGK